MTLAGLAMALSALLPFNRDLRITTMGGSIALMIGPPCLYNWWLWRRKMKDGARGS